MQIGFVTIAYCLPAATKFLFESAVSTKHAVEYHLFLHSKHEATTAVCDEIAKRDDVVYYRYRQNRGLSNSWNEGILCAYANGADVVIVANDDMLPRPGDLDKLAEFSQIHKAAYVCYAAGWNERHERPQHSSYGFFAINPVALEVLGCFDENLFPIYCEDTDYRWRAKQAGLVSAQCMDTHIVHGSSMTTRTDPDLQEQNKITSIRNVEYYRRKWGGAPGKEFYKRPFDNYDIDLYIDPSRRHNPYGPQYDRTDKDIVKL